MGLEKDNQTKKEISELKSYTNLSLMICFINSPRNLPRKKTEFIQINALHKGILVFPQSKQSNQDFLGGKKFD